MKKLMAIFIACLFSGLSVPIYAQVGPFNGHYYQLIQTELSWGDAKTAAEGMSYLGAQGHLATITSSGERNFVISQGRFLPGWSIGDDYNNQEHHVWFGGTDAAIDGTWVWVTGEPWAFTDWEPGEPNGGTDENCTEFQAGTAWNDSGCGGSRWYLVEYEPESIPAIPTLSQYGMSILALLMLGVGLVGIRRFA